jgi:hypothetical protein
LNHYGLQLTCGTKKDYIMFNFFKKIKQHNKEAGRTEAKYIGDEE